MQGPSVEDIARFHRFFAVEANNDAWQRTLDDPSERDLTAMLHAAHAAAYHWAHVGNHLNTFRATMLLAHVHAFCGHGDLAWTYATACHDYITKNPREGWETSFTLMILAQAAHVSGRTDEHREAYRNAEAFIATIESNDDRDIVMMTWKHIPRPA